MLLELTEESTNFPVLVNLENVSFINTLVKNEFIDGKATKTVGGSIITFKEMGLYVWVKETPAEVQQKISYLDLKVHVE
jgi:hypothetical protein